MAQKWNKVGRRKWRGGRKKSFPELVWEELEIKETDRPMMDICVVKIQFRVQSDSSDAYKSRPSLL